MLAFLMQPLARWFGGAVALIGAVLAIYMKGRGDAASRIRRRQAEQEIETRRSADDAAARYRGDGGAGRRLRDGDF